MSVLEFDSEWFGINVGRHDGPLLEADRWSRANNIDLLYSLLPIERIRDMNDAVTLGFRLVDVRVEFTAQATKGSPGPVAVRCADAGDIDRLAAIASVSFRSTRFYNDGRLVRERVNEMYANWVREAWDNETIFVYDQDDGSPGGFVTVTSEGDIGLIAVEAGARKRGAGKSLCLAAIACVDNPEIGVVTQGGNLAAQRTFQSCGFRSVKTSLWLHRWYDR